jgi:hypothetical protein
LNDIEKEIRTEEFIEKKRYFIEMEINKRDDLL